MHARVKGFPNSLYNLDEQGIKLVPLCCLELICLPSGLYSDKLYYLDPKFKRPSQLCLVFLEEKENKINPNSKFLRFLFPGPKVVMASDSIGWWWWCRNLKAKGTSHHSWCGDFYLL